MAKKKKTIRTIPQERTPVREQDPQVRVKNFDEVNCGYSLEEALNEAERCLLCPEPACVAGCPVNINIPKFIEAISAKDFRGAYDVITASNLLPAVCGRVCPQENAVRGRLRGRRDARAGRDRPPRTLGRRQRHRGKAGPTFRISSRTASRSASSAPGPAGMACAADMAKAGCEVTVFEAFHQAGGVLKYGIPDFRLPNAVVDAEIENLRKLGVKFECNTLVGRLFTIEQMRRRDGLRRRLHRHRRRLSVDARHPRRLAQRRAFRQRTADPLQPDARQGIPELRHAAAARQARRRDRRRQHRHGRHARQPAARRREGVLHLSPLAGGMPGARGRGASRRGGGHRIPLAHQPGRDSRRRQGQCPRHALHPHGARRAGRFRAAAPGAGGRQRVRVRDRSGRVRDRHQRQPDHRPDFEAHASTSAAISRPTRTWRPRWRACSPAAISSPAPPP